VEKLEGEHPVRSLRINRRMTQFQLSKILKINQATLSAFETGAVHLPKHVAEEIAKIFKTNKEKLIKESDDFYSRKKEKLMQKYR